MLWLSTGTSSDSDSETSSSDATLSRSRGESLPSLGGPSWVDCLVFFFEEKPRISRLKKLRCGGLGVDSASTFNTRGERRGDGLVLDMLVPGDDSVLVAGDDSALVAGGDSALGGPAG